MSETVSVPPPRLLHRQRALLSLLRAFGGKIEEKDFQSLLFDYSRRCRERGVDAPYEFVPRRDGPRSFTAIADRDRLARRGIVAPGAWNLTAEGRRIATQLRNRDVAVFAARLQRGNDDLRTRDNRQPEVIGRDHAKGAGSGGGGHNGGLLATIGYEGRSYEAYFNELLQHDISLLCDVRRNPRSRKWGFSKRLLSQGCEELGIRYESLPELGIDSGQRADLGDRAAYGRLFARYEATTLPRNRDAVAVITGWIEAGQRVALTCFERDSGDCHRSRLASAIVKTAARPLQPRHL